MMHKKITIDVFGYACGLGAGDPLCQDGPRSIEKSFFIKELEEDKLYLNWVKTLAPLPQACALEALAAICAHLSAFTQTKVKASERFLAIGGDHSSGIGVWSGALNALETPMGLLWVDAHLDAHTHQTSHSGNVHGMGVACLLGEGDKKLTNLLNENKKLDPKNLCLFGIRSYETEELAFLQQLGVRIFFMHEIKARGEEHCLQEALGIIGQEQKPYGISIDLDGFDPKLAPAVGTAEPHGLAKQPILEALRLCAKDKHFLGMEIAEFNPHRDVEQQTEKLIAELIKAAFAA